MKATPKALTIGARILSVFLGLGAAVAMVAAVISFFTIGPESGAVGVIIVDSVFGSFILFAASRFLWIYAVKRDTQRALLMDE